MLDSYRTWDKPWHPIAFVGTWVSLIIIVFVFGDDIIWRTTNESAPLPPPSAEPQDWQQSLERIGTIKTEWSANSLAFHPDGEILAAATGAASSGDVELWQLTKGRRLDILLNDNRLTSLDHIAMTTDGSHMIATGRQRSSSLIALWKLDTYQRRTFPGRLGTFDPTGTLLAGVDPEGILTLWRVTDGMVATTFTSPADPCVDSCKYIQDIAWHPDGQILAMANGRQQIITVFNLATRTLLYTLPAPESADLDGQVGTVRFSADGTLLAGSVSGFDSASVFIWQMPEGQIVHHFDSLLPETVVTDLAFSPDSTLLALSANTREQQLDGGSIRRGYMQLWQVDDGTHLHTLSAHEGRTVDSVAFSPDGKTLASGGGDGYIHFWRPR